MFNGTNCASALGTNNSNSNAVTLRNALVVRNVTAAPEPSTVAHRGLTVGGLFVLTLVARKRRLAA